MEERGTNIEKALALPDREKKRERKRERERDMERREETEEKIETYVLPIFLGFQWYAR